MWKQKKLRENNFCIILRINFLSWISTSECIFTLDSLIKHEFCLVSDLSLFSSSEIFQLSFEFYIQMGAEISSVITRFSFAEKKIQVPCGEKCGLGMSKQPLHDWWTGAVHTISVETGSYVSSDLYELSAVGWLRSRSCLISYPSQHDRKKCSLNRNKSFDP